MARMSKYMEALKNMQGGKAGMTAEEVLGIKSIQAEPPAARQTQQTQQGQQQEPPPAMFESQPNKQMKFGTEASADQVIPAAQVNSQLRKVKIMDDFGDEIEEEIDFGKEENIQELVSSRHKSKHLEAELETLRGELTAKELSTKKLMDKYGKFEGMTAEQIADALFNERGGLSGLVEAKMQEAEAFRKLSKEEQSELLRKQEEKKRSDEIAAREAKLDQRLKDIEAAGEKAKAETLTNLMRSSAGKYCPNKVENKELLKINEMIFKEAQAEISSLAKAGTVLTQTIIEQKFKKAYMNNKGLLDAVKSKNSIQGNGIIEATKAALNVSAGAAATQTSSADTVNESALLDKWFHLTVNGKGSEVDKEVNSNPSLYKPIFRKLAQRFRHKR